jgi:hydroxyacylglutathione hydrolase
MINVDQWICTICGYNMISKMPDVCPFCGAAHSHFIGGEEGEQAYKVTPRRVNDYVTQLLSVPRLGYEHAAYCVHTDDGMVWVDCPSVLNRDLDPVEAIFFTHHHFMGACNQYQELWGAKVHLHALDADLPMARQFSVDERFYSGFEAYGIQAFHIDGHTPGFTMYIYKSVLFICDYAFPPGSRMHLNPYGPQDKTRIGASKVIDLVAERPLEKVCGYNYVVEFDAWYHDFLRVARQSG